MPTTIPCAALLPSVVDGLSSNQTVGLCCVGVTYYLHRTVLVNRTLLRLGQKRGSLKAMWVTLGSSYERFPPSDVVEPLSLNLSSTPNSLVPVMQTSEPLRRAGGVWVGQRGNRHRERGIACRGGTGADGSRQVMSRTAHDRRGLKASSPEKGRTSISCSPYPSTRGWRLCWLVA